MDISTYNLASPVELIVENGIGVGNYPICIGNCFAPKRVWSRCAAALSKHLALPCAKCLRSRGAFFAATALRLGGTTMALRWASTQLSEASHQRCALHGSAYALLATCLLSISSVSATELGVRLLFIENPVPLVDWHGSKCEDIDIPDAGFRAFRRSDGKIVGIASHYITRTLTGSTLQVLRRESCRPALVSQRNPDPAQHDDQTWLAATWTDDGINVAAIGHHEYHGELHPGMCAGKTPRECRYGVLTLYVSHDGGANFKRVTSRPIAAVPVRQSFDQGKDVGFFQPSNIFESGGFKYVFVRTSGGGAQTAATCLMRAKNPLEPGSWQIFDGKMFRPSLFDPYKDDLSQGPICKQVSTLNGLVWTVVRHRQRGVFIAVLTVIEPITRTTRLATSVSRDALNWSKPKLIDGIALEWSVGCGPGPVYHYPSLVDPDAPGRNFDTTDDEALLFLTAIQRSDCKMTMDRDLVYRRTKLSFE
jgi:hypothetical protein